jgi:hypothetical protein
MNHTTRTKLNTNKSNRSKRRNNNSKNKKTLKDIINKYIFKKGDICCEDDIDRNELKEHIFDLYKNTGEDYLDSINNDLIVFIGYFMDLKHKNDKIGIKLWNKLNKFMIEDDKIRKKNIEKLLDELPLYYVLSFIGKFSLTEYTSNKLNNKYN